MYIGTIPELDDKLKTPNANKADLSPTSSDVKSIPSSEGFILLTDHHFEADIVFPREGKGAKTVSQTIRIYNPAPDTERRIKAGNAVILKAGYNTDEFLPIICATQITRSQITKSGTDRILTLTCSEAYNAKRKIRYSATYGSYFTYADAIKDILSVFAAYGVPTGRIEWSKTATTQQFGETYAVFGAAHKTLDKMCEGAKLRWYIAGGEIFIQPKSQKENAYLSVLRVSEENVKNTVEFLDDITNKDAGQIQTKTSGVKVTVNLNGNVNKSDGLQIVGTKNASEAFKEFEGRYLIECVSHSLSYEGSAWDTTVEARG